MKFRPVLERFMEKVEKTDTCWLWKGSKNDRGYGFIKIKLKTASAHRTSYELFNGPIPEGKFILHSCDNPSCVNPAHLSIGTHIENMAGMAKRRRATGGGPKGEANGSAKLTDVEVVSIREQHKAGLKVASLAVRFRVSRKQIQNIVTGRQRTEAGSM